MPGGHKIETAHAWLSVVTSRKRLGIDDRLVLATSRQLAKKKKVKPTVKATHKGYLAAVCFIIGIVAITFSGSLDSDRAVFTSDDPMGLIQYWHSILPGAWLANWSPDNLVGIGSGQHGFQPTSILMCLLSPVVFVNWIWGLDVFGAGIFFFLFLRQKQCSVVASLFGAVVYAYCSINFSLVY